MYAQAIIVGTSYARLRVVEMDKHIRIVAILALVAILLVSYVSAPPQVVRQIYQKEYAPLEFYPKYHYASFTVVSLYTDSELSLDLKFDLGENYTEFLTEWVLYQLPPEQFEESFNITEACERMSQEDWDIDNLGAT